MKLSLTKKEKDILDAKGHLFVERSVMREPKNSIIYGIGINHVWDKVDQRWVLGDTQKYIHDKKNVGRRKEDYKDNGKNTWSGAFWWDCERSLNPFSEIGETIQSGKIYILRFHIEEVFIDRLEEDEGYLKPILKIYLIKQKY